MNTFDTIVEEWIEHYTGISLDVMDDDSIPVISSNAFASKKQAIVALKFNDKAVVIADPAWIDELSNVVNGMHSDLLFSQFGVYELARVTYQYGATPSGPSWYLFADKDMWHPVDDDRPVRLSDEDMKSVDRKVFWHCFVDEPVAGFGVFEGNELVGLATVNEVGGSAMEIAMDVDPAMRWSGIGRAVVNSAGQWILRSGSVVMASVGAFNVPSARTLRSLGLVYMAHMISVREGPFTIFPQALGSPSQDVPVYDYYPRSAMNSQILPGPNE